MLKTQIHAIDPDSLLHEGVLSTDRRAIGKKTIFVGTIASLTSVNFFGGQAFISSAFHVASTCTFTRSRGSRGQLHRGHGDSLVVLWRQPTAVKAQQERSCVRGSSRCRQRTISSKMITCEIDQVIQNKSRIELYTEQVVTGEFFLKKHLVQ